MKKKSEDLMRIADIIDNDRVATGDCFIDLLTNDLKNLLNDYFEFNNNPVIHIDNVNGKFKINISLLCSRLKNFLSLPSTK